MTHPGPSADLPVTTSDETTIFLKSAEQSSAICLCHPSILKPMVRLARLGMVDNRSVARDHELAPDSGQIMKTLLQHHGRGRTGGKTARSLMLQRSCIVS